MKKLIVITLLNSYFFLFPFTTLIAQILEYGDAPEGALAYPATGQIGLFPTCKTVGPAAWIQHNNFGASFGAFDMEGDGNAGLCPGFNPYNADECKSDMDAGLIVPGAFDIVGGGVVPCVTNDVAPLGVTCTTATWGLSVDIMVNNNMPNATPGYVNVLIDWDQNGMWGGSSQCPGGIQVPEHVLVNQLIPNPFGGPLSALQPPPFLIGPNPGYVWARFTISEQPVGMNWDGSGGYEDGETEDYLLLVILPSSTMDFGDAPDGPYPTLLASNGARHTNNGICFMGALIDNEADGQPTANADGDDLSTSDDEDGVTFTSPLTQGQWATLNVVASVNCMLNAWMDFNQLNGWADANEQIFANVPLIAGINALTFQVPASATLGTTYLRFRVNMNGFLSYTGLASEGEVEDYRSTITGNEFDFGDAPEGAYAYVPSGVFPNGVMGQFPTCISVGPATWIQHSTSFAFFGNFDKEMDGNAGSCPGFSPYDQDECKGGGDAGLIIPGAFINTLISPSPPIYLVYPCVMGDNAPLGNTCTTAVWGTNVDIMVQNLIPAGGIAYVNVLMDWDQNGTWAGTSPCPLNPAPEHVLVNFIVPSGYIGPLSGLQPPPFLIGPNPSWVWARFSITNVPVVSNWNGSGTFEDGETEDYLFIVSNPTMDFGDAPDGPYPTLLVNNGARHINDGLTFLGGGLDTENDGFPVAGANGDDTNLIDDEDGVTFTSLLVPGQVATLQVIASTSCMLNAWMDLNQANGWADAGEQIFTNFQLSAGLNTLSFPVPANAMLGPTYLRFRVNLNGSLSYNGLATEGEVEDYADTIVEQSGFDFGDAPEGAMAYPANGVIGQFPTCITILPSGWIQQMNFGAWFGPSVDFEFDGNAGQCPLFSNYNADECFGDGDAGLILPGAFTLTGLPWQVVPCPQSSGLPLGNTCTTATWGQNIDIDVHHLCQSGIPHFVNVLIDWDQNGNWGGSSQCPGALPAPEHVLVNFPVPFGYIGPLSGLQPPPFLIGPNPGHVWVRFTFSEVPVTTPWDGHGSFEDGETEDYLLLVTEEEPDTYDFGDAPDIPFPTLLTSNGARHLNNGVMFLGALIDNEADGQPGTNADGDDLNLPDDEDGIAFTSQLFQGQTITINVTASVSCILNAWMDFNQANGWQDPGEQIFTNFQLTAGVNAIQFLIPANALLGPTYLRFRINANGGLSYNGYASEGEVEDYLNMIVASVDYDEYGDAPEGALAYPSSGVMGNFPTCKYVLPSGWIQHLPNAAKFGGNDYETDGNAGLCPAFNPNTYDQDDCKGGNAGLIIPGVFTITGPVGSEVVVPCIASDAAPLGNVCNSAVWGVNVDIQLTNLMSTQSAAFVNVLMDWDHDGLWGGGSTCLPGNPAPEHVLVNFPVPFGFVGPLSVLAPPPFLIGPNPGYVWTRFTISDIPINTPWDGSGFFEGGETEDYLLLVTSLTEDYGDAPDGPYPTLFASNGARHTNNGIHYLGAMIDNEADGQPSANADGDDLNNLDDEDGVVFTSQLIQGQWATLQITVSANCLLNAWMDFNLLNGWADANEQIFINTPLTAGLNALTFQVPANATPGPTFGRFRVNANGNLSYNGAATEGEVEDYPEQIFEPPQYNYDFGDAPEDALAYPGISAYGWFPTCKNVGNAGWIQHSNYGAFFGPNVDLETDGNAGFCPLFNPNTYNMDECVTDGDAGLVKPDAFTITGPYGFETVVPCIAGDTAALGTSCSIITWGSDIDITLKNTMPNGAIAYVNVLVDWNQNGTWGDVVICPVNQTVSEHVLVNLLVPNGFNGLLSQLAPPPFQAGPFAGYVWARFTVTEVPVATPWDGSGSFEDGETEDYLLRILEPEPETYDFGDAPDPSYPTLMASNGARHLNDGITFLGALIDAEADGQPGNTALGDDLAGLDDEDGVTLLGSMYPGSNTSVQVVSNNNCLLNSWFDFNANGSWADGGEQVFTNQPLVPGINNLTVNVHNAAAIGDVYARFRVNQNGGISYSGYGYEGEVEDYTFVIINLVPGDANCDGSVNVLDVIVMIGYIMGQNPDPFCFANADVNGDGTINVLDVVITINIILGG